MELIERRDEIIDSGNSSTTFLIPPLIASPDFLLDFVVGSFHILFEYKWLTEIQKLSFSSSRL